MILVEILYITCMIEQWCTTTGNGASGGTIVKDHQKSLQVIEHEKKVEWQRHLQTY